jgi:uncharacterized protein YsxB (DUF464 family)
MIKVIFATARNHFSGIKVTGHAYSDEPGRDLVCAAVSTLSQTLLNAIEVVGKIPEEEMLCQVEKGYLKFSIDSKWQSDSLDLVFKTILIGIEGIERTYPKYVKHIIKEVHGDVENF